MSKIKDFETELALRSLAKALPGHEEAINSTLDKVASLQAREKELEGKYQEVTDWYVKMKTRMLAAEAELARMKAQKPQYQIQKFTETNSRALWVDVSGKQEAENQVVHGYTWRAVYAEPRPAVLPPETDAATMRDVGEYEWFVKLDSDEAELVAKGANWMRQQAIALGCKPQKFVVVLPAEEEKGHGHYWLDYVDTVGAIEAAGREIAE